MLDRSISPQKRSSASVVISFHARLEIQIDQPLRLMYFGGGSCKKACANRSQSRSTVKFVRPEWIPVLRVDQCRVRFRCITRLGDIGGPYMLRPPQRLPTFIARHLERLWQMIPHQEAAGVGSCLQHARMYCFPARTAPTRNLILACEVKHI